MRSRRTQLLIGLIVLAFAVAGWAPAAGAAHGPSKDQKTANAGVLVQDDFTAAWTEQPTSADSVKSLSSAMQSAGATCKTIARSMKLGATQAHATSNVFTNGGATAQNSVVVFKKRADAAKMLTAFKSASTQKCLTKVLPKTLPALFAANPDIGKVSSVKVTVKPGSTAPIANANANWESTVKAKKKNGKTVTLTLNTEGVQDDRAFDLFEFANVGSTQLDGIHDHLIASSVGRIEGSLGTAAVGETPELAAALVPVPGYTYEEATPEQQLEILAHLADPDAEDVLLGQSIHSVVQGDTTVGVVFMSEFAPSYAGLPGFKESGMTAWLASDVESAGGGTPATTTVNGRTVGTLAFPDGTFEWVFWAKNIFVAMYGSSQAAMQPFVDAFLTETPA